MEQPAVPGMEPKRAHNGERLVCKLKKSLYGLKQAGRIWHNTLKDYLLETGWTRLKTDQCVFIKHQDGKSLEKSKNNRNHLAQSSTRTSGLALVPGGGFREVFLRFSKFFNISGPLCTAFELNIHFSA